MLVVNVIMKDDDKNDLDKEDNEMNSPVEKDKREEKEIEEVEGGGDVKSSYKPDYQYTKEELLKYANHPLSRQKPIITDPSINSESCWLKSSGWNVCKRSDTPTERGDDSHKIIYLPRRLTDPRERVRKEQDGIVLSPQRRSFNSGCFVTVAPNTVIRPNSESVKEGVVRRIGSGRIINRDWEFRDKENADEGYPFRSAGGPSPRERDERFDIRRNFSGISTDRELVRDISRESLSREKEMRPDPRVRDRDRLLPRYTIDKRRFEAEEPEWFSGGPTSQHDTIELRGFEDSSDAGSKSNSKDSKSNPGSCKNSSEEISVGKVGGAKGGGGGKKSEKEGESERATVSSSPEPNPMEATREPSTNNGSPSEGAPERTDNHSDYLNLEDLLQIDNLPLLTQNGGAGEGNQSSSRFSQWFRRDSPSDASDTPRRSSAHDELIKNIISDISDACINIPSAKETEAYFAPISPAGATSGNSLLEMLQSNQQKIEHGKPPPSIKDLEASGKVTNVEELEARMRQGATSQNHPPSTQNAQSHSKKGNSSTRKEEELIAFKKLLKQVAEGGVTAANDHVNRSPASAFLFQMLNKPTEPSDLMGQVHQPPSSAQPMHVPHDLVYKLLHVQEQQRQVQQQQEYNKLLLSSGRFAPPHVPGTLSPLPPELQLKVAASQPAGDLLSRPEAQAILQGLRQGEITPQHLIQQLQNPAMQPRHREVLTSILKLHGNVPRPASPLVVPPDPTLIQQLMLQQQLRNQSSLPPMHNAFCSSSMIPSNPLGTSPITLTVPHTGLPHRVPSPRELMLHTQTIMQSALIKKKLEEQRENYRKRQEIQRAASPNLPAGGVKSSGSSANTPNNAKNSGNPAVITSGNNSSNKIAGGNGGPGAPIMNNNNGLSAGNSGGSDSSGSLAPQSAASSAVAKGTGSAVKSPTPLAFTPTSVLRKMTAENSPQLKDGEGNKMNKYNELFQAKLQRQNDPFKPTQSSRLLNNNNQLLGLRGPQQQWSVQKQPPLQQPLQQGRAIVKGSSSSGYAAPAPPPLGTGLVDLPYGNNGRGVFSQRSKWTMPAAPLVHPNLCNSFPASVNRVPPARGARNSFPQFLPSSGGDGDIPASPPGSNQLSHWFTPELLAQAQVQTRAGKSDSTLNMVSVEELERLQQNSAPVIN